MQRKLLECLAAWKSSKRRKPLLLSGARQTGKTCLIDMFAKTAYSDYVKINFEKDGKPLNSIAPLM